MQYNAEAAIAAKFKSTLATRSSGIHLYRAGQAIALRRICAPARLPAAPVQIIAFARQIAKLDPKGIVSKFG